MAGVTAEAVQWENEKKAKHLTLDVDQEKPQTETVMEMLMILLRSHNFLTALMGTSPPPRQWHCRRSHIAAPGPAVLLCYDAWPVPDPGISSPPMDLVLIHFAPSALGLGIADRDEYALH